MKVISIVNHKGGVGKTTTAFNFAAELAARNKRVLLIDFDMQGNLSSALGIKENESLDGSISDAIEDAITGNEDGLISIYNYPDEVNLDIIPCDIRMANTLLKLNSMIARELYLKMVINRINKDETYTNYEYCIIDCAPSVMIDFQNALVASDEILIVANPDTFSTSGMSSLLREYKNVAKYFNPNLNIAGVLINNVDNRTVFTKAMVSQIKEYWKDLNVFDTVIPASIRVKESVLAHLPVFLYEPQNPVSRAFSDFTDEYLGNLVLSPEIEREAVKA